MSENTSMVPASHSWTEDQLDLITRTVAKGATPDELKLFLYTAHRMGLDPLARQIHAVKRFDSNSDRSTMAIQVGIDGFRLVADRTGKYAPGDATVYEYNTDKTLYSATAHVKKFVAGTWHQVSETAHWDEYVAEYKDKTSGEWKINPMWKRLGHVMLAKCAEARALRRAFPAELSGVYEPSEMAQAGEEAQTREDRQKAAQVKADATAKPAPAREQIKTSADPDAYAEKITRPGDVYSYDNIKAHALQHGMSPDEWKKIAKLCHVNANTSTHTPEALEMLANEASAWVEIYNGQAGRKEKVA